MFKLEQTAVFQKWRMALKDSHARSLIAARLTRLGYGHLGDAKAVGEGLLELRIHYGPGYRIYLERRGDVLILLLCGGDKSSQQKDIVKAKKLAANWSIDEKET